MTVVGVTTVFLALSLLLGVVTLMAKLVAALGSSTAAGAPHGSGSSTASPGSPGEQGEKAEQADLERIAVAAYALHRASRVSVRGPAPASAWLRAGRQHQVDRESRVVNRVR